MPRNTVMTQGNFTPVLRKSGSSLLQLYKTINKITQLSAVSVSNRAIQHIHSVLGHADPICGRVYSTGSCETEAASTLALSWFQAETAEKSAETIKLWSFGSTAEVQSSCLVNTETVMLFVCSSRHQNIEQARNLTAR